MPTLSFDHIHLRCPSPEATALWFEDKLGAEIIRSMQQGAPRFDLKLGGINIFLLPEGKDAAPAPSAPYLGIDHFGFAVTGLDAYIDGLKAKGVTVTMEPNTPRPGIRIAFIRGPENISIEILERFPV
jgi:catechol 2,3-dioxygenase-like lactoylglutathione lyase family enzyme